MCKKVDVMILKPGLIALYDIGLGNGVGLFLVSYNPGARHGAEGRILISPSKDNRIIRLDPVKLQQAYSLSMHPNTIQYNKDIHSALPAIRPTAHSRVINYMLLAIGHME